MNIDSYCQEGKDGNFCLLFRNTNALSNNEIHTIFSEFGNVHSVKGAGNERGMRFVAYESKIEAINAIMGLKGHESIKLVLWMNKEEKDLKYQNKYPGQQSRLTRVNDHEHSSEQSRNNRQFSNTTFNSIPQDKTESTVGKNNGFNNFDKLSQSRYNKSVSNNLPESVHKDIQSKSKEIQDIEDGKCDNNGIKHIRKLTYCLSHQGTMEQELVIEKSENTKDKWNGYPDNNNSVMKSEKLDDDQLPELITTEEIMPNKKDCGVYTNNYASMLRKIKIVPAGEVIVANISKPFGTAYILHLFEAYHPLCISKIVMSPQSIRYCYVYFHTPLDAVKVEKKFDKFQLHDNNLIVLRPEKLASDVVLV